MPPSCRTCDVERRWKTRIATIPSVSDAAACTCSAGWTSAKPSRRCPSAPFPAPPPVPRRSRSLPTDRRRRVNDAYSAYTSGNLDVAEVESATSTPTHHFDCFRFCCFRSSCSFEREGESTSHRTRRTTDLVDLTTVCRCSAVVNSGNGNKNGESNSKRTPRGRRRHKSHILIACIVALPVTCLAIVALFLMVLPLRQSTTGTAYIFFVRAHSKQWIDLCNHIYVTFLSSCRDILSGIITNTLH